MGPAGDKFEFRDVDTMETIELPAELVGDAKHYIKGTRCTPQLSLTSHRGIRGADP